MKNIFQLGWGCSPRYSSEDVTDVMMRMMEIRNMCMVIDFCKSYLLQINYANGMNIVFAEP